MTIDGYHDVSDIENNYSHTGFSRFPSPRSVRYRTVAAVYTECARARVVYVMRVRVRARARDNAGSLPPTLNL